MNQEGGLSGCACNRKATLAVDPEAPARRFHNLSWAQFPRLQRGDCINRSKRL